MKKGLSTILATALVLAGVLSGCTDESNSTPAGLSSSETSVSSTVAAPSSSQELSSSTSIGASSDDSVLLIIPTPVEQAANMIDDSELIALFENPLYKNGSDGYGWFLGRGGIQHERSASIKDDAGGEWALVTNVANMQALRANLEAVFSVGLVDGVIFPTFIDIEMPTYKEIDGKLYYSMVSGGVEFAVPDFSKATVASKKADSFEITVPMVSTGEQVEGNYTFKIIQQNGTWVFDNFYLFTPTA